ncbi:MAG: T9SS type A sorting domain-containing protein [Bacteroidetes bacterium]|nr:T9SS type A sorting domain-containing protein [Bacteroidota bacterium]
MKKIILFSCLLSVLSFITKAQVIINDNFDTFSQGWNFYTSNCPVQYIGEIDSTTSVTGKSFKITKTDCNGTCIPNIQIEMGYKKNFSIPSHSTKLAFSVSCRANSTSTQSVVTSAVLRIYDERNNVFIANDIFMIAGGTTESGWINYSNNFTLPCPGTDSISVYLFSFDAWNGGYCRSTWFDDPYLEVTETNGGTLPIGSQTLTICNGESITVGGNTHSTPGVYTDTISSAAYTGCDSSVTTTLIVNSVNVGTFVSGNTITATATGATYQWIDCTTGDSINGETNQNFTATTNGDYAVIVEQNGCIDTSNCVSIIVTNIGEWEEIHFEIFPNPATDKLFVKYNSKGSRLINILDITGRAIYSGQYDDDFSEIEISKFVAGIYFIRITDSNSHNSIKKFIKK